LRQGLTVAVSCLAVAWGISSFRQNDASDQYRDIETHLLRLESFDKEKLAEMLDNSASLEVSSCDTHAQKAMLLLEMPLAEAALRSGADVEFDQRVQSLEARSRSTLACAPRESFVWLLAFNLEVLHGRLDEHAFELLNLSYETSPYEAWIALRRIQAAIPVVLVAPERARGKILTEFRRLVSVGFADDAARSYLASPAAVQSLLREQIRLLTPDQQERFLGALRSRHS
jgi:hypothetical protein